MRGEGGKGSVAIVRFNSAISAVFFRHPSNRAGASAGIAFYVVFLPYVELAEAKISCDSLI
jgi:hypothetical protein